MDNLTCAEKAMRLFNAAVIAFGESTDSHSCCFVCPVCGGTAIATRGTVGGHIHASCCGCGTAVAE